MTNKYLKPMLDTGSPRVFSCNTLTHQLLAANPDALQFFRNKQLNTILLIKDSVPVEQGAGGIGTKIYFPFNNNDIYEGGRTIFVTDPHLKKCITEQFGENALNKEALDEDLKILHILDHLPSLDPFLLKDVFQRRNIPMNNDYFIIGKELWHEIESFMLQQFEALVKAAFPDAMASDDMARKLINTIWEARDLAALQPLIDGFRLPQAEALDIFASWKGIIYYTFQYQRDRLNMLELFKWLQANEAPVAGIPTAENKDMQVMIAQVKASLRKEWQTAERIISTYQDGYDKMFKHKTGSADFLKFLRESNKLYWDLGSSIGKINQGVYCWKVTMGRYTREKMPWDQLQSIMRILVTIFPAEKKAATSVAW